MTSEDILTKLRPWLAKHRRPAYKPIVEAHDGFPLSSKFGGTPWIGPAAPRPTCGRCRRPVPLFLQLHHNDLPAELRQPFGPGLLQLFYCPRKECDGHGGWEPFADQIHFVRIVHPNGPSLITDAPHREGSFPPKRIVSWTRLLDLPTPVEHDELGLKYHYDFQAGTVELECPELGLVIEGIREEGLAEIIADSHAGDKLGGWPAWIQNVEYPNCPQCGKRMVYVFQVDSEDNIPFMFGDAGCGHITQCPDHKDIVAFGWACC